MVEPNLKCGSCLMFSSWYDGDYFISTQCGHIFHFECVRSWIFVNGNENEEPTRCPSCENGISLKNLVKLRGIDPTDVTRLNLAGGRKYTFKIAILGDSGCGKTSLLQSFTKGIFPMESLSTCGCDVCFKTIEFSGRIVKLSIWDCGGQDRFAAITPNFLRNVEGIMMVYDITRQDSFENRKRWLHLIRNYAPIGIPSVLIGNKSDLKELRTVSTDHAKNIAESIGMNFLETSAKEFYNVEASFRLLVGTILENYWKHYDINDNNSIRLSSTSSSENDNNKKFRSSTSCC